MIHFQQAGLDPDVFWHEGPQAFGIATGTDLRIGRNAYTILRGLGIRDIAIDYITVDTLRVARETFAAIWEAWRDGFRQALQPLADFRNAQGLRTVIVDVESIYNRYSYGRVDPLAIRAFCGAGVVLP